MKQFKTFHRPVQKIGATSPKDVVEVGDRLRLVLRDNSETEVFVASSEKGSRRLGWDLHGAAVQVATTSSQNATTAASDDTTGDALANALKTSYNAAQVDLAALFTVLEGLGSPTSTQNATTAATTDPTRLALANALRLNILALIVDTTELQAEHPEIGDVPVAADVEAIATDDATANSLLNNLQDVYNELQAAIATGISAIETSGYYIPRTEDVIAVSGLHQIACPDPEPGEYGHLHDGPEDGSTFDPVINPLGAPVLKEPGELRETLRKPAAPTGGKLLKANQTKAAKQTKAAAKGKKIGASSKKS